MMQYRTMGKTGDRVSVLGYGCMRLPEVKGGIDEKRATAQIRRAIDAGVNYIDTALPYHRGESEPFLGRALGCGYREKVCVATKLPPWSVKKPEDMDRILASQIDRISAGYIDYYLVHALNGKYWDTMKSLGVLAFLERAKADGRIRYAGFSYHGDRDTFKEIVDGYDWDFCQIQYNYLDRENQAGLAGLRHAASKNLGVVIMEPLRGGSLAGNVPAAVRKAWDEAETRRTAAKWALRWIWDHPEVTVVLSGMNDDGHIDENLRIAADALPGSLTDAERALVDRADKAYRSLMKAGCTGCQYCMPCPAGVNIPLCFEMYNKKHLFPEKKDTRMDYALRMGGVVTGAKAQASQCKKCGKCEKDCPQNLPVQKLLEEVAKEFDGFKTTALMWLAGAFLALQRRRTVGTSSAMRQ